MQRLMLAPIRVAQAVAPGNDFMKVICKGVARITTQLDDFVAASAEGEGADVKKASAFAAEATADVAAQLQSSKGMEAVILLPATSSHSCKGL
jgi:hypothetical protein